MPEHWTEKHGFTKKSFPFSHSRHMDVNLAIECLIRNAINAQDFKWFDKRCFACKRNFAPYCNPNDKLGHMVRF